MNIILIFVLAAGTFSLALYGALYLVTELISGLEKKKCKPKPELKKLKLLHWNLRYLKDVSETTKVCYVVSLHT